jgi:hypothetical protein
MCCACCGWMCSKAQAGRLLLQRIVSMAASCPPPRVRASLNQKRHRPRAASGASAPTSSSLNLRRRQADVPSTSSMVGAPGAQLLAWPPPGTALAMRCGGPAKQLTCIILDCPGKVHAASSHPPGWVSVAGSDDGVKNESGGDDGEGHGGNSPRSHGLPLPEVVQRLLRENPPVLRWDPTERYLHPTA